MYIECKSGRESGAARIVRIAYSQSGKTLYYGDRTFQSLKGRGFKANYVEVGTGDFYWISGPKKNGSDRLYGGVVKIDADARKEYWSEIRNRPELAGMDSYRCDGKYSK